MTITLRPYVAADPALPDRDALVDPQRAAVPVDASQVEVLRCKYRVGESLRVLYRCATPDGQQVVTVRASAGRAPRWWVFPDDRRLPHIAAVMAPAAEVAALAGGRAWTRGQVAEYAPERSLTVRAIDDDGRTTAFVKHVPPGSRDLDALAARYDRVARALRSTPGVRAPRSLGRSNGRGLLVLEAMRGVCWSALEPARQPVTLARMGRAIAALHDVAVPPGTPPFGRLAPPRLQRSAAVLAAARPDVAAEVAAVVDRLLAAVPDDDVVLLHGDCHPKNVIVDGARLALIDLDQAGTGAAAADIGSLLARLRVATILGVRAAPVEHALVDAFTAGYRAVGAMPSARSQAWHTAAALIAEQAVRAVNRLRPDVLDHLGDVVHAAHELLAGRSR